MAIPSAVRFPYRYGTTSQYHAWPSAARGIAMLRMDKFPYPRQQTRGD